MKPKNKYNSSKDHVIHSGYTMNILRFPSDYESSGFLLSDSRSVICKSFSSVNFCSSWQKIRQTDRQNQTYTFFRQIKEKCSEKNLPLPIYFYSYVHYTIINNQNHVINNFCMLMFFKYVIVAL